MPYPRLRWRLATLLEADEIDLWPELLAARGATVRPSEVVAIYPHRWSVPRDTWHRLFSEATREIAILAYSGLFIADDAGLVNVLAALSEAQRRARVREIWSAHLADLLDELMAMRPDGFERLASRLLREADFDSVNVTGKSGDGGIDGLGVYRLGLVSFPVFFQCKRYRGSVGPGAVRDFRGAMAGRGDKAC
jgi:HJR/Mrr/RecB family endonuclease